MVIQRSFRTPNPQVLLPETAEPDYCVFQPKVRRCKHCCLVIRNIETYHKGSSQILFVKAEVRVQIRCLAYFQEGAINIY